MMFPRALMGFMRAAAAEGKKTALKSVSELDPKLLAKARKLGLGVGTVAGAFGSLVGVGGGVLIGPVILNACPAVPQRVISGTSLAAVATTGATAGAVYWSSECVDARSAVLLAATAVLTAPFGAKMTHKVDCQRLRRALGYWLYFVAPLVPLKAVLFSKHPQKGEEEQQPTSQQQQQLLQAPGSLSAAAKIAGAAAAVSGSAPAIHSSTTSSSSSSAAPIGLWVLQQLQPPPTAQDAFLAATGALAGFASGMLGIGGGTVVTPMLALATGASQQVVLGTSLLAMVVPSLVGLAQHQRLGNVDWRLAAALAVGTSIGGFAGSHFAVSAPPGVLEGLFAVGMLLLGKRTLATAGKGVPKAAQ